MWGVVEYGSVEAREQWYSQLEGGGQRAWKVWQCTGGWLRCRSVRRPHCKHAAPLLPPIPSHTRRWLAAKSDEAVALLTEVHDLFHPTYAIKVRSLQSWGGRKAGEKDDCNFPYHLRYPGAPLPHPSTTRRGYAWRGRVTGKVYGHYIFPAILAHLCPFSAHGPFLCSRMHSLLPHSMRPYSLHPHNQPPHI